MLGLPSEIDGLAILLGIYFLFFQYAFSSTFAF